MDRRFRRHVDALEDVFSFVSEFASRNGLDDSLVFKLNLVIEELFVNMVKYNPGNPNDVEIGLSRDGDRLAIRLIDSDVEPFDITQADQYDSNQPLEARPIGRLGIHLVRSMVDKISYEYGDRRSTITLIKNLGRADVHD